MAWNASRRTEYSEDEQLVAGLALDYHLPLATDWLSGARPPPDGGDEVAAFIAAPEDTQTCHRILRALSREPCVAQGDPFRIEPQLANAWREEARLSIRLEVCAFPDPLRGELWDYAQALSSLLGAQPHAITTSAEVNALIKEGRHADCDLIVFDKASHPLARRLLSRPVSGGAPSARPREVPFAVLIAQEPRRALERILVIISGDNADQAAVDWVLRLARPSTATVTALAVLPPVPAMYHGLSHMEHTLHSLLTTDTALGNQMCQVARRLARSDINGVLRIRQGTPDHQIRQEVVEGDHDLVVMATRPCRWWLRKLKRDTTCWLLSQVNRPVLLAEPITA